MSRGKSLEINEQRTAGVVAFRFISNRGIELSEQMISAVIAPLNHNMNKPLENSTAHVQK